jgi:hypothetical protein
MQQTPHLPKLKRWFRPKSLENAIGEPWSLILGCVHCELHTFTSSDPLLMGTSLVHNTFDMKDIKIKRACVGANSMLFIQFRTPCDHLIALQLKRQL